MPKIQTNKNQHEFLCLVGLLLLFAKNYCEQNGYLMTGGDLYRDPRCPYGSEKSRHHMRLAIDINLIKNGKLIRNDEGHRDLGAFWLSLSPKCSWGGRWSDFNHYSYLE